MFSSSMVLFEIDPQRPPVAPLEGDAPRDVHMDPIAPWPRTAQRVEIEAGLIERFKARRFVELEEWANQGEPLPYPAAKELVEELFGADRPGVGAWTVGGQAASDRLPVPSLHLTAERDLIAPPETAASGEIVSIKSGHVGMIVGTARHELHQALRSFLAVGCR